MKQGKGAGFANAFSRSNSGLAASVLAQSDPQRSGLRSPTWMSANHERRQINPEPQ